MRSRLAKGEVESLITFGRQFENDVDIFAGIIGQVTNMVRSKVASWPSNIPSMGPENTIPEECIFAACTIIRDALIGSLPLDETATSLRREELRKAHEFLDQISRGEVIVQGGDGYGSIATASTGSFGGRKLLDF